MTLLELLREHLTEWPEDVRAISQDSDGSMNENLHTQPMPWDTGEVTILGGWSWSSEAWYYMDNPYDPSLYWELPLADDASTAIVTREMWEATP